MDNQTKKPSKARGWLIGCGIALAVACVIGVIGLALGLPVWQGTQSSIACAMTRARAGHSDTYTDCQEWLTTVKRDHSQAYSSCATQYGIFNDDREALMGCFIEGGIDPDTILGR